MTRLRYALNKKRSGLPILPVMEPLHVIRSQRAPLLHTTPKSRHRLNYTPKYTVSHEAPSRLGVRGLSLGSRSAATCRPQLAWCMWLSSTTRTHVFRLNSCNWSSVGFRHEGSRVAGPLGALDIPSRRSFLQVGASLNIACSRRGGAGLQTYPRFA